MNGYKSWWEIMDDDRKMDERIEELETENDMKELEMDDDKNRCQSLADIHEDIEKYFVQLNDIGHDLGYTELGREVKTNDEIKEDILNIIKRYIKGKIIYNHSYPLIQQK